MKFDQSILKLGTLDLMLPPCGIKITCGVSSRPTGLYISDGACEHTLRVVLKLVC